MTQEVLDSLWTKICTYFPTKTQVIDALSDIESSAGVGSNLLFVEVAMSDDDDTDLSSVAVSLAVNGGAASAMTGKLYPSRHMKLFVAELDEDDTFSVSFNAVDGYATPTTITGTKGAEAMIASACYHTTIHTIAISSNQTNDATIAEKTATLSYSYGGQTVTKTGLGWGTNTVKVPSTGATNLGVTMSDTTGYATSITKVGTTYKIECDAVALTLRMTESYNDETLSVSSATATVYDDSTPSSPVQMYANVANGAMVMVPLGTPVKVVWGTVEGYTSPEASTAVYKNAFLNAVETIEGRYTTTKWTVNVGTNQESQADIASTVVRVTYGSDHHDYTGAQDGVILNVPVGVTPAAAVQSGAPSAYTAAVEVDPVNHIIDVAFTTEVVTVTLVKNYEGTGSVAGVSVTVKDENDVTLGTGTGGISGLKIPFGTDYHIVLANHPADTQNYVVPYTGTVYTAGYPDYEPDRTITIKYNAPYVDLGLTSGTLWATGNITKSNNSYSIGAETEPGCLFSWGNTDGHAFSDNETIVVSRGTNGYYGYSVGDDGFVFKEENYFDWQTFLTADGSTAADVAQYGYYEQNFGNGTPGMSVDGDIASNDSTHDAALARLGSPWRMPTKTDFQELYDETDNEWVTDFQGSGMNGHIFYKKTDHSVYIFLPAALPYYSISVSGQIYDKVVHQWGGYWSSSFYDAFGAYYLGFSDGSIGPGNYSDRYFGYSVRAVQ